MYTKLLLVLLVTLPLSVVSRRPTHCERNKGDLEFRCGKDDYRADRIHIRSIADANVSFKVSKWYSTCGQPGIKYSDQSYILASGGSFDVEFGEALSGICNELFVYNCKLDDSDVNCLEIVSVYPA